MKTLILILSFVAIHANATTAVLCGNPDQVDQDNDKATMHLIFDNSDSRSPGEVRAYSKGHELVIQSVSEARQKISIKLQGNGGTLQLGSKYIDPAQCENYSEDTFLMELVRGTKKTIIKSCRCFQG